VKSRSSVRLGPVALQILTYLGVHPNAQDTVEGIAQWWVMEQRVRCMSREVQRALAELVTKGMVLERTGRDGRAHYRLNSRKRAAIERLLGETFSNSSGVPFEPTAWKTGRRG